MGKLLVILCAAWGMLCHLAIAEPHEHEWTNWQGKTIKAEFLAATDQVVTITLKGETFKVKMTSLAPQSQALAKKLKANNPWQPQPRQIPRDPSIVWLRGGISLPSHGSYRQPAIEGFRIKGLPRMAKFWSKNGRMAHFTDLTYDLDGFYGVPLHSKKPVFVPWGNLHANTLRTNKPEIWEALLSSESISLRPKYKELGLPVENQDKVGSCELFTFVDLLEYKSAIQGKHPHLSEQYLLWAARVAGRDNSQGAVSNYGFSVQNCADGVRLFGICHEHEMRYTGHRTTIKPPKHLLDKTPRPSELELNWITPKNQSFMFLMTWNRSFIIGSEDGIVSAQTYKEATRVGFTGAQLDAIIASLRAGTPVGMGLAWPNNRKGRTLDNRYFFPASARGTRPGHAVVAVGFVKSGVLPGGGCLELRNSWGPEWADGGYAFVSFDYLRKYGCSAYNLKSFR